MRNKERETNKERWKRIEVNELRKKKKEEKKKKNISEEQRQRERKEKA